MRPPYANVSKIADFLRNSGKAALACCRTAFNRRPPAWSLRVGKRDALESASFFVGIRSDGTVTHILPDRSSGDTDMNTQALQILKSLRFAPVADDTPLAWGFVDFYFGSNALLPPVVA